jgi:hypothetical protein
MNSVSQEEFAGISDLLTEFYWRLDHGGGRGLTELFAPNGRFVLPKRSFDDPAEFERWAIERASDGTFVSRHLWTNLRLNTVGERQARAEGNIVIFQRHGSDTGMIVGNFVDLVERGSDGRWRFLERHAHVDFEGPVADSRAH